MLLTTTKDDIIKYCRYPLVIFLMGPTASGKTRLAIALKKQKLKIKIISVDSALVYKGMNIGTAKPLSDELKVAPHKLIDIRDLNHRYSVADFYRDAVLEIKKIIKSGYIPLLVGGTMLYFKVLLQGLFDLPKSDQKIRDNLEYEARKFGWINMYNKLKLIDPIALNKIHWNDHNRIIRALEVFLVSGKTWTELQKHESQKLQYRVLQFAIMPSTRTILHNRIEQRFYRMLEIGFENEAHNLFEKYDLYNKKQKLSIPCVGYKQMLEYLSGKIQYNDMIFKGIYATRRLAHQQLTWLRHWSNLYWLNGDNTSSAVNDILVVLSKIYLSRRTVFEN